MIQESNQSNAKKDDLMLLFVPEIGENTIDINEDVKQYVNNFLNKLYKEYDTKPNSIGLVGDISTLTKVVGRLVQDYEKYKGLNEEFALN
ncbi:hypothetical protein [Flavobacterium sp.]|uniref:hypothetical protein n=1 Tax=Flavobacterium sp. TaxID=239 RepID=UPI0025EE059F|nr:hypothetical protein [Flavobacterium sp.]